MSEEFKYIVKAKMESLLEIIEERNMVNLEYENHIIKNISNIISMASEGLDICLVEKELNEKIMKKIKDKINELR